MFKLTVSIHGQPGELVTECQTILQLAAATDDGSGGGDNQKSMM